jgi:hypothetical protein
MCKWPSGGSLIWYLASRLSANSAFCACGEGTQKTQTSVTFALNKKNHCYYNRRPTLKSCIRRRPRCNCNRGPEATWTAWMCPSATLWKSRAPCTPRRWHRPLAHIHQLLPPCSFQHQSEIEHTHTLYCSRRATCTSSGWPNRQ